MTKKELVKKVTIDPLFKMDL